MRRRTPRRRRTTQTRRTRTASRRWRTRAPASGGTRRRPRRRRWREAVGPSPCLRRQTSRRRPASRTLRAETRGANERRLGENQRSRIKIVFQQRLQFSTFRKRDNFQKTLQLPEKCTVFRKMYSFQQTLQFYRYEQSLTRRKPADGRLAPLRERVHRDEVRLELAVRVGEDAAQAAPPVGVRVEQARRAARVRPQVDAREVVVVGVQVVPDDGGALEHPRHLGDALRPDEARHHLGACNGGGDRAGPIPSFGLYLTIPELCSTLASTPYWILALHV